MKLPAIALFRKTTLSDNDLLEKVAQKLNQMYEPPIKVPSRSIPAKPDEDFDILVGELIIRFKENLAEKESLEQQICIV